MPTKYGTRCGCLYCKGILIPESRGGWKGKRNKLGHMYGSTKDACKNKKPKPKKQAN